MIKAGILIGVLLLLIGSVYAEDNTSGIVREDFIHRISNDTNSSNQSSNESVSYTEDDMMNAINYTDKDSGEYVDDINMVEDGKYPNTPIGTKPSPGFESIVAIMAILLMTIINTNKR